MNQEILVEIISSAPILFFLFGIFSRLIKSDLEFPFPLPKLFSIYILIAIGIKGGVSFGRVPIFLNQYSILLLGCVGGAFITLYAFYLFRSVTSKDNSVAISASYGSISAITFVTGTVLLDKIGIAYDPIMIATMALMEFPAILVAAILNKKYEHGKSESFLKTLHHSLTNSSVLLLVGSFIIGACLSSDGWSKIEFFYEKIFYGMLTLFLLDLGLLAAKRVRPLLTAPKVLFLLAIVIPVFNALCALFFAKILGFGHGNTLLLMLLFGSASYIAAPAAMRSIVPDANVGIYLGLALGITFPFNILIGIPTYLWLISYFLA